MQQSIRTIRARQFGVLAQSKPTLEDVRPMPNDHLSTMNIPHPVAKGKHVSKTQSACEVDLVLIGGVLRKWLTGP
jgi:hypothetical protein